MKSIKIMLEKIDKRILNEQPITIDEPEEKLTFKDKGLELVQDWLNKFKNRFRPQEWVKIKEYIQKIVETIEENNTNELKKMAAALGNKAKEIAETNPKGKDTLEQIHSLLIRIISIAQHLSKEDKEICINIINECIFIYK